MSHTLYCLSRRCAAYVTLCFIQSLFIHVFKFSNLKLIIHTIHTNINYMYSNVLHEFILFIRLHSDHILKNLLQKIIIFLTFFLKSSVVISKRDGKKGEVINMSASIQRRLLYSKNLPHQKKWHTNYCYRILSHIYISKYVLKYHILKAILNFLLFDRSVLKYLYFSLLLASLISNMSNAD